MSVSAFSPAASLSDFVAAGVWSVALEAGFAAAGELSALGACGAAEGLDAAACGLRSGGGGNGDPAIPAVCGMGGGSGQATLPAAAGAAAGAGIAVAAVVIG